MTQDLIGKFRSKRDFLKYFGENLQLYVPPEKMINKDFLKKVLSGDQKLLHITQVKFVNVPHYDELSVKSFFPRLQQDPEFMVFMPDPTPDSRVPDRSYFWNVLHTVRTEYMENVLNHANDQRMAAKSAKIITTCISQLSIQFSNKKSIFYTRY